MDSKASAKFPDVPVKLLLNTLSNSEDGKHEATIQRKETFRPPYDPDQKRFSKARNDSEQFTFSKKIDRAS